jgi:hypothetical protein
MTKLYTWLLCLATLASACNLYPGSDARTEDLDVVFTQYNDSTDFSTMSTYMLRDEVIPIVEDGTTPSFTITPQLEQTVLDAIEANLAAYGWTKVDSVDNPDMIFASGITVTAHTNIYENFPAYGWGYYYPYYNYQVSTYPVGNIILVGLDNNDRDPVTNAASLVWVSLIQGPLINNVDDPLGRVERDIEQAFLQSTYLKLNP